MESNSLELKSVEAGLARYPTAERIEFARLTAMAFGGMDLRPLRDQLISKVIAGTAGAGEGDRMRLHVGHDGLVMDGISMFGFFAEWWRGCAGQPADGEMVAFAGTTSRP